MNKVKLDIKKGLLDTQVLISEQFLVFIIIVMGSLISNVVLDLISTSVILQPTESTVVHLGNSFLITTLVLMKVFCMGFWSLLVMQFFKQSPEESTVIKIGHSVMNSLKMGLALFIFMTPIMFVSAVVVFIGMSAGLESLVKPLFIIVMTISSLMMIMLPASMTYNKGIVVNIRNSVALVNFNFMRLLVVYLIIMGLNYLMSMSWINPSITIIVEPIMLSLMGIIKAVLMLTLFNQTHKKENEINELEL